MKTMNHSKSFLLSRIIKFTKQGKKYRRCPFDESSLVQRTVRSPLYIHPNFVNLFTFRKCLQTSLHSLRTSSRTSFLFLPLIESSRNFKHDPIPSWSREPLWNHRCCVHRSLLAFSKRDLKDSKRRSDSPRNAKNTAERRKLSALENLGERWPVRQKAEGIERSRRSESG